MGLRLMALLVGLMAQAGAAQAQAPNRDGIIGTWMLVSAEIIRADGTIGEVFGPSPKGIMVFTPDGRFSLFQSRAELPRIAANDRAKATPEEAAGVLAGSIAYYGTYAVDEDRKALSLALEGSTYANLLDTEQRRDIVSLTRDELRFTNPRTPSGVTLRAVWSRAKPGS
jgi:hypothetical protein